GGKCIVVFFSSRRRHTRCLSDWSSDVCSSDLVGDTLTPAQTAPVSEVDVVFSEQIDLSTFDYHDVSLTLNGGTNLVTSAVTVSRSEERRVGKERRSTRCRSPTTTSQ